MLSQIRRRSLPRAFIAWAQSNMTASSSCHRKLAQGVDGHADGNAQEVPAHTTSGLGGPKSGENLVSAAVVNLWY